MKCSAFIALTLLTCLIFSYNVHKHYFLGDDAFISFRYASNLVKGCGPVWNCGERVEGYTNFLWVILMAAGMKMSIKPEIFSNVIGIISGAAVLFLLYKLSADRLGPYNPLNFIAPLTLSLSRTFTGWCTGGLETQFFALMLFGAFLCFIKERREPGRRLYGSSILFAIAGLTRPEGIMFAAAAGGFFLLDVISKKRKITSFLFWLAPVVTIIGGHLIWRKSYYGYWTPNSFYAKVNGIWIEQGIKFVSLFQQDYKILYFLPLALLTVIIRHSYRHLLFLTVITIHILYLIGIGGDRFEFRFLIFIFPFLYGIIAEGITLITQWPPRNAFLNGLKYALAAAGGAALIIATFFGSLKEIPDERNGIASLHRIKSFADERIQSGKIVRSFIKKGLLPDDVLLCVYGAGALPYYTEWPAVDYFGINDEFIAHLPVKKRRKIAHEKTAPLSYLQERGVEVWDRYNRLAMKEVPRRNSGSIGRGGKWRTLKIDGYYMNFVSFLSDEQFEKRFGRSRLFVK